MLGRILFLAMVAVVLGPSAAVARKWTDNTGRTIDAKFVRVHQGNVVLLQGQKVVMAPFENLVQDDQQFVREELDKKGQGHLVPSAEMMARQVAAAEAARSQKAAGGQPRGLQIPWPDLGLMPSNSPAVTPAIPPQAAMSNRPSGSSTYPPGNSGMPGPSPYAPSVNYTPGPSPAAMAPRTYPQPTVPSYSYSPPPTSFPPSVPSSYSPASSARTGFLPTPSRSSSDSNFDDDRNYSSSRPSTFRIVRGLAGIVAMVVALFAWIGRRFFDA